MYDDYEKKDEYGVSDGTNVDNQSNSNSGNYEIPNTNNDYYFADDGYLNEDSIDDTQNLENNYYGDRKETLYDRRREEKSNFDQGYYNNHDREYVEKPKPKSGKRLVAVALIFSMIGSVIGGAFGAKLVERTYKGAVTSEVTGTTANYTINTSDSINTVAAVAESTLDKVVGISTKSVMRDFLNRQYQSQGTGSGVIVDSRGYILTNNHVISTLSQNNNYFGDSSQNAGFADDITVVFNDGSQLPAQVIWADNNMDLAMLKVEPKKPLPVAKLGDSDSIKIGEMAIAIGNPFAIEFHGTVTAGYISGLNRNLSTTSGGEMDNLIQTDASINQGNSGGPLLNSKGEVIGINTMKISMGEGMGFAIPINTAKPVIEQIIETGDFDRVALGVSGVDVNTYQQKMGVNLGVEKGIIVINIYEDSPAKVADLRTNDIITKVGNIEVNSIPELRRALTKFKIGDKVTLEYVRDGEKHNVDVVFKEFNINQ